MVAVVVAEIVKENAIKLIVAIKVVIIQVVLVVSMASTLLPGLVQMQSVVKDVHDPKIDNVNVKIATGEHRVVPAFMDIVIIL